MEKSIPDRIVVLSKSGTVYEKDHLLLTARSGGCRPGSEALGIKSVTYVLTGPLTPQCKMLNAQRSMLNEKLGSRASIPSSAIIDTPPPFATVRGSVFRGFPAANRLNSTI